jgi:RNA polymerase sigma-70 factor, ECF subfamily
VKALSGEALPGVRETLASDERIIGRVLKGHTQDYRELMLRYQASAFRLAYRVLTSHEDAEDAVQDAFIKAFDKLETCRERGRFWPWLRRIVLNACFDRLRYGAHADSIEETDDDLHCSPDEPVESQVLSRVTLEEIRGAIAGLPGHYRVVVVLRFQEELSYKEIADVLGDTVSTVR